MYGVSHGTFHLISHGIVQSHELLHGASHGKNIPRQFHGISMGNPNTLEDILGMEIVATGAPHVIKNRPCVI